MMDGCWYVFYLRLLSVKNFFFFFFRDLLKYFITIELINWKQLCSTYEAELKFGSASSPATHVFNTKLEDGAKRWTDFKNRVVEHVSIF